MLIIDTHTHLGYDHVFEREFGLEELLNGMKNNRVDISIVQPGTTLSLKEAVKQHNSIAALSKRMPGRIFGMANPNPHLPEPEYRRELERCIEKPSFLAVELHPFTHAVNPNGKTAEKIFEAALELEIPVMIHTGSGIPWSLPSRIIPIAQEKPDLKIILAHAGGSLLVDEAIITAKLCPNVYLETSWLPGFQIRRLCRTLGAHRVMFGSDHGDNVSTELRKYENAELTPKELELCLGGTAAEVFGIQDRLNPRR